MKHVERHLGPRVREALDAFRVVVLHGARQSGKTTLAKQVAAERGGTYTTLDDEQSAPLQMFSVVESRARRPFV